MATVALELPKFFDKFFSKEPKFIGPIIFMRPTMSEQMIEDARIAAQLILLVERMSAASDHPGTAGSDRDIAA